MTAAAQASATEPVPWDPKLVAAAGPPAPSDLPKAPVIPKTVDYGHGHGMSCEEEYICTIKLSRHCC